jgi:hypothetical protein
VGIVVFVIDFQWLGYWIEGGLFQGFEIYEKPLRITPQNPHFHP